MRTNMNQRGEDILNILREEIIMKINIHQTDEPTFFIACSDDGVEITCELLFTFPDPLTGNNYMVYTDNTEDQDEKGL